MSFRHHILSHSAPARGVTSSFQIAWEVRLFESKRENAKLGASHAWPFFSVLLACLQPVWQDAESIDCEMAGDQIYSIFSYKECVRV